MGTTLENPVWASCNSVAVILVISASNRSDSQSLKISKVLQQKVIEQGQSAELLDLHAADLPLFKLQPWEGWPAISDQLSRADGYVFVVPEWHGMVPPALLNMLMFASTELAHKPVLMVGVSSGGGGAYPLAELKSFGGKNRHYVFVPAHIVIRQVESLFNSLAPDADNQIDSELHERAEHALAMLIAYAQALTTVRGMSHLELLKFPNGM